VTSVLRSTQSPLWHWLPPAQVEPKAPFWIVRLQSEDTAPLSQEQYQRLSVLPMAPIPEHRDGPHAAESNSEVPVGKQKPGLPVNPSHTPP
jgi:hypothetical protein